MVGRSTDSNLLHYTNYICESFNCKTQVDSVYTDFSKAFDRMDHSILLAKSRGMGMHGNLYRWLTSYLLNRSQLVNIIGYDSVPYRAISGIPQGSNLGPLMFLIFVNDLLGVIKSECLAYADDIKLFKRISDRSDCDTLQTDIDTIVDWCSRNRMSLNIKKMSGYYIHKE